MKKKLLRLRLVLILSALSLLLVRRFNVKHAVVIVGVEAFRPSSSSGGCCCGSSSSRSNSGFSSSSSSSSSLHDQMMMIQTKKIMVAATRSCRGHRRRRRNNMFAFYHHQQQQRLWMTTTNNNNNDKNNVNVTNNNDNTTTLQKKKKSNSQKKIAILGGGLAGLSTAFHLLDKLSKTRSHTIIDQISILDTNNVGMGGASSVAGGLVHPLSPRGKVLPWGLEGLQATNELIEQACKCSQDDDDDDNSSIILRDEIYRLATSQQQYSQFETTAKQVPKFCQLLSLEDLPSDLQASFSSSSNTSTTTDNNNKTNSCSVFGALRLHNGCKVIHVPSYLKGLWLACLEHNTKNNNAKDSNNNNILLDWKKIPPYPIDDDNDEKQTIEYWNHVFQDYDTIVLCAGSGLFQKGGFLSSSSSLFPIQLVRGQSLEIRCQQQQQQKQHALLVGKYISPLPDPSMMLVGATHEFQADPLTRKQVLQELKERTYNVSPKLWDGIENSNNYYTIEKITMGYRVQSQRSALGRLPLIGKLEALFQDDDDHDNDKNSPLNQIVNQKNIWIFTGLSSRGLLYHGIYGNVLAQRILVDEGCCLMDERTTSTTKANSNIYTNKQMIDWWREKRNKAKKK